MNRDNVTVQTALLLLLGDINIKIVGGVAPGHIDMTALIAVNGQQRKIYLTLNAVVPDFIILLTLLDYWITACGNGDVIKCGLLKR